MSIYERYKEAFNEWKNDCEETGFQDMVFQNGVEWRKFLVELTKKVKEKDGDDDARKFLEELLNVQEDWFSQEYVCFEGAFYASLKLVHFIDSLLVGKYNQAYKAIIDAVNLIGKKFSQGNAVGDNNARGYDQTLWSLNDPLAMFERIFDGKRNWACDAAYGWLRTLCGADGNYDERSIRTLTVKENGAGVVGTATLQKLPNGSGRLSLNLDNAFMRFETSYLESVKIACNNLIKTSPNADLVWRLELGGYTAWSSPIGGGSAGIAWGLLAQALEKGEDHDFSQIACTATLDASGKLGKIESLKEKLNATLQKNNDRPNLIRAVIVAEAQDDLAQTCRNAGLSERRVSGKTIYASETFRAIPCATLDEAYEEATRVWRENRSDLQFDDMLPKCEFFTGRVDLLNALRDKLSFERTYLDSGYVALHGSAGCGKTAVLGQFVRNAREALDRDETAYGSDAPIYYFPSGERNANEAVDVLLKQLLQRYPKKPNFEGTSNVEKFREELEYLSDLWNKKYKSRRQLIVVDAVDQIKGWFNWIKRAPDGFCFLVSTRFSKDVGDFNPISFDKMTKDCQIEDAKKYIQAVNDGYSLGIKESVFNGFETQTPTFLTLFMNLCLLGAFDLKSELSDEEKEAYRTDPKLWTRTADETIESVLKQYLSRVNDLNLLTCTVDDGLRFLGLLAVARTPVSEPALEQLVPIDKSTLPEETLCTLPNAVRQTLEDNDRKATYDRYWTLEPLARLFFKSQKQGEPFDWIHPAYRRAVLERMEKEQPGMKERLERLFAQGCDRWQEFDSKAKEADDKAGKAADDETRQMFENEAKALREARAYALKYRIEHWLDSDNTAEETWKHIGSAYADISYVEARSKEFGYDDVYRDVMETTKRCFAVDRAVRETWKEDWVKDFDAWNHFMGTRLEYFSLYPECYPQEIVNELKYETLDQDHEFYSSITKNAREVLKGRYWLNKKLGSASYWEMHTQDCNSNDMISMVVADRFLLTSDKYCTKKWSFTGSWLRDYPHLSGCYDVSHNGKLIALKKSKKMEDEPDVLRIWDVETDVWEDVTFSNFNRVKFSPDGSRLVMFADDKGVCIWEASTGKVSTFSEYIQKGDDIYLSDGSPLVVYDDEDQEISANSREGVKKMRVTYSRNRSRFVVYDDEGNLGIGYTSNRTVSAFGKPHGERAIEGAIFSPNGDRLVVHDCYADVSLSEPLPDGGVAFRGGFTMRDVIKLIRSDYYSPDGARFVSCEHKGTTNIWDVTTKIGLFRDDSVREGHWIKDIAFSPDGSRLVVYCNGGTVGVHNTWNQNLDIFYITVQEGYDIRSIAFSHDDSRLAVYDNNGNVSNWDVLTGKPLPSNDDSQIFVHDTHDTHGMESRSNSDGTCMPNVRRKRCFMEMTKEGKTIASVGVNSTIESVEIHQQANSNNKLVSFKARERGCFIYLLMEPESTPAQ